MRLLILCFVLAVSYALPSYNTPELQLESEKPSPVENDESFKISDAALQKLLGNLPKSLVFLGQSPDGKAMFLDDSTSLSWQESREHCSTLDLRLLSITSQEQQDFVLSRLPTDGTHEYWTAAREHRWQSGFWWDGLKTHPQFMTQWAVFGEDAFPYKLCAVLKRYYGNAAQDGLMLSRQCTDKRPVLCEAYSH